LASAAPRRFEWRRESEVERVFGEVAAAFGGLNILVNNAGVAGANKPTHEITEAEWDFVQGINVKGVFFGTKHAVPLMRRAGGGSIINLSSIYGLVGAGDVPPYHASKGAVRLMSKNDALIYAPDKIRVNSIHPGFIWTPMVEGFLSDQGDVQEGRKAVDALHPLGHIGEADDIAWGAVYLASDEAKFVTGAELVIDGGYTAR
jgi:NAD(P)-dependent dehydrogenase (short-subunit alcohol dehydrogenase family)